MKKIVILCVLCFMWFLFTGQVLGIQNIERVSVANGGVQADGGSSDASLSADGRFVAFYSFANNLVPGDTNGIGDIFVHDRNSGTLERVSVASGGIEADGESYNASISEDGRFVAFYSFATNLVPGDTNGERDIFVFDRNSNTIERVSIASGGIQANDFSIDPAISADGRFVTFFSFATNLVAGDTNNVGDIFVYDRNTSTTERVSVSAGGVEATGDSHNASISADGRFVSFYSFATNLVAGDTNGQRDIFVYDRNSDTVERVSVGSGGIQADNFSTDPSISADGRFVAFSSIATNLVPGDTNGADDIFVYDRNTATIERVSVANGGTQADNFSINPSISADGRFVAFSSFATNLVPGDTNGKRDIFVYDRNTDTIQRFNVGIGGVQAEIDSNFPSISADGSSVAFHSFATKLVPDDTNGTTDVFVVEPGPSLYISDPGAGGTLNLVGTIGTIVSAPVTITNGGVGDLPVTNVALAGDPQITLMSLASFTVPEAQSIPMLFACNTASVGSYTTTVNVSYMGANNALTTATYTVICTISAASAAPAAQITIFDPSISKLGFLLPGQAGVTGEQIRWDISVHNRGDAVGTHVVFTDTLVDSLKFVRLDTPKGTVNITGQTVTLTIDTLAPGETLLFSIYTTVLQGTTVDNTICMDADNLANERCVTGRAISQLPRTGESPNSRSWLVGTLLLSSVVFGLFSIQKLTFLYLDHTR